MEDRHDKLVRVEQKIDNLQRDVHYIIRKQDKIIMAIAEVKTDLVAYVALVNEYIAAQVAKDQTIEEAVAAAILADDAGEEVDLVDLRATIADAAALVPVAPVAPVVVE